MGDNMDEIKEQNAKITQQNPEMLDDGKKKCACNIF